MAQTDGTLKWAFETGYYVQSSLAVGGDGTVYVGSDDHTLHAVNPDGTLKWEFVTGDWVTSSPAIGVDGTVYVGSWDDKLYAIYDSCGGLPDSSWPMFHHDLRHTGRCATSQTTIDLLIEHLKALNLNNGIENSFDAKLDAAQRALEDLNQNNNAAACGSLEAFINEVEAQRGKKISEVEAEELIYEAEQIIAMICG